MTDIVEGLRAHSNAFNAMSNAEWMGIADAFLEDAAAEIARLRAGGCARDQGTTQYCAEAAKLAAENEKLRAVLREIAKVTYGWEPGVWSEEEGRKYFASLFFDAQAKARAALEGKDD